MNLYSAETRSVFESFVERASFDDANLSAVFGDSDLERIR